jgi:hypothetical protein
MVVGEKTQSLKGDIAYLPKTVSFFAVKSSLHIPVSQELDEDADDIAQPYIARQVRL